MWHLLIYDFCFFSSLFNILKLLERTVTKKQIRTRTAVKQLSSLHVLKEDTRDWREENLSTHIPPRIMKKFFEAHISKNIAKTVRWLKKLMRLAGHLKDISLPINIISSTTNKLTYNLQPIDRSFISLSWSLQLSCALLIVSSLVSSLICSCDLRSSFIN
ncbi:hypothetical protein HanOQP8_Chr02g0081041 [Helianthus annuus]|nr:hypothetical protein HanIR_Chr02g0094011 [Helianthus annuus]KAJ0619873.1 hypothetical protein HanHA89_Chr02g0076131 [Helianthus annuus]KAJ0787307.1 hypothetical protein HanOQP8_Chr02g0081041 [Helianthus annuus]